jgi:hypothetical protein
MKKACLLIFFATIFFGCEKSDKENCATPATVRDLTGLDGCRWVFELEDGIRLEPLRFMRCGTPPISKETVEDPLLDFVFQDGKKVFISYKESTSPSICMVGQVVEITCIKEAASISEE